MDSGHSAAVSRCRQGVSSMTPDVYEQRRLRLLQCRVVVSLMRKWAADLAVQMMHGALNDLDSSWERAPEPGDQPAKRETA
jgi:hypothetical protein